MAKKFVLHSTDDIEEDYTRAEYCKSKGLKNFFDVMESFVYAIIAVLVVFIFFARLTVVSGDSMNNTLKNGEYLIVANVLFTYEPENGDIVVIHGDFEKYYSTIYDGKNHQLNNNYDSPIVKRVIATEGQKIKIDYNTKEIFVDGVKQSDDYAIYLTGGREDVFTLGEYTKDENGKEYYKPYYNTDTKIFEATVPNNCVFVLGDNRDYSADSRLKDIGFVPEEFIVGKAVFRLTPISRMGGL